MGKEVSVPCYKLNNGALMPAVALGGGAINETPEETKNMVLKALEVGYRAFDTASFYGTEASLGAALQEAFKAGTVKREDVFVSTKIWVDDMHPPDVIPALRKSLSELKLEYVDMYLVHWPIRLRKGGNILQLTDEDFLPLDLVGCWKALEQCVELGLTKGIGGSNFSTMRLKEIEPHAKLLPAVNQMELHPGCDQAKVREYCTQKGILVTAWSALGAPGYGAWWGSNAVLDSPVMKEIAEKLGKTPAQIALRWGLDKGVGLTVKSSNAGRLAQNLDVFDFTLSPEDHEKIKTIPAFKIYDASQIISLPSSPYKSLKEIWDD